MPKKALGRGLEALLPTGPAGVTGVLEVNLEEIDASPQQPRRVFGEEELGSLAASIKEHGVIQPVVLTRGKEGRYQLVAGERRVRACRLLGLTTIPAVVRHLSPQEAAEMALVENLQREDLNPLEVAAGYQTLIEQYGLSQEEVALRTGKSRAAVANTLRLLRLPEGVRRLLAAGSLSEGHARALLGLAGTEVEVVALGAQAAEEHWSVRQIEEAVRQAGAKVRPREKTRQQVSGFADLERKLEQGLGTRVRLKGNPERGRIEIAFFSPDELERLLSILGALD